MKCHLQGLKNEIISAGFLVKHFFKLKTTSVVHDRSGGAFKTREVER